MSNPSGHHCCPVLYVWWCEVKWSVIWVQKSLGWTLGWQIKSWGEHRTWCEICSPDRIPYREAHIDEYVRNTRVHRSLYINNLFNVYWGSMQMSKYCPDHRPMCFLCGSTQVIILTNCTKVFLLEESQSDLWQYSFKSNRSQIYISFLYMLGWIMEI